MAYYIDFDAIDKFITISSKNNDNLVQEEETTIVYEISATGESAIPLSKEVRTRTFPTSKEVDSVKYELIMNLVETILSSDEEIDSKLGMKRALQNSNIALSLAFTTLIEFGIIKEN